MIQRITIRRYTAGLKLWAKVGILAGYVTLVVAVYSQLGQSRLNEIVRIPVIDYLAVLVLAVFIAGGLWVARRIRGATARRLEEAVA